MKVASVLSSNKYTHTEMKNLFLQDAFDIPLSSHNSMDLLTFELLLSGMSLFTLRNKVSPIDELTSLSLMEKVLLPQLQTSFLASKTA